MTFMVYVTLWAQYLSKDATEIVIGVVKLALIVFMGSIKILNQNANNPIKNLV